MAGYMYMIFKISIFAKSVNTKCNILMIKTQNFVVFVTVMLFYGDGNTLCRGMPFIDNSE